MDAHFLEGLHVVVGSKPDQRVRVWLWQHPFCLGKDKGRSPWESRSATWPDGQILSCSQELFNIHSCKRELSSDAFLHLLEDRGTQTALLRDKEANNSSSHSLCMYSGLSSASFSPSEDVASPDSWRVCAAALAGSAGWYIFSPLTAQSAPCVFFQNTFTFLALEIFIFMCCFQHTHCFLT